MNKRLLTSLIALSLMLPIAGCGTSDSPIWVVKTRGRQNAIEYIEKKYNEKPTILKTHAQWGTGSALPGLLPSPSSIGPTGILECEMELNGCDFDLIIDGDTKDYTGYDTYEKDYICEQIAEDITGSLNLSPSDIAIRYTNLKSYVCDYYYHDKFQDLETFYNNAHTFVYLSTLEDIDESLVYDFAQSHMLSNPKCVLRVFIIQYDDDAYIPYQSVQMSDYNLGENEHVIDYYDVFLSGSQSSEPVSHNAP